MVILDASALIALLNAEPGAEKVEEHIAEAAISAVNLGEVAQFHLRTHRDLEGLEAVMAVLDLAILPVDSEQAYEAARLRMASIKAGQKGSPLSQADSICLAAAKLYACPVLSADREWKDIADREGIALTLIR